MSSEDYRGRNSVTGPIDISLLLAYCECFSPCYSTNIPLLLLSPLLEIGQFLAKTKLTYKCGSNAKGDSQKSKYEEIEEL